MLPLNNYNEQFNWKGKTNRNHQLYFDYWGINCHVDELWRQKQLCFFSHPPGIRAFPDLYFIRSHHKQFWQLLYYFPNVDLYFDFMDLWYFYRYTGANKANSVSGRTFPKMVSKNWVNFKLQLKEIPKFKFQIPNFKK